MVLAKKKKIEGRCTFKQVNFAGNLISQILWRSKLAKFYCYKIVDFTLTAFGNGSSVSILAKLDAARKNNNF